MFQYSLLCLLFQRGLVYYSWFLLTTSVKEFYADIDDGDNFINYMLFYSVSVYC